MKRDEFWLDYMQECAQRIQDYCAGGREAFMESPMAHDAVMRRLQTISDSYERLTWERREQHPGFPWEALRGLRNLLVHEGQSIDVPALWEVVELDIPELIREIDELRSMQ
jgi:uncharacterized protein with HEPN domain